MSFYENLVLQTQVNYTRYRSVYASKRTAVKLSRRESLPYSEQIREFVRRVREAECIVVGGASGLSAAGGGDFYYGDTPSFRKYFGKYAEKYGFKGAFDGMYSGFDSREEQVSEIQGDHRFFQCSRCCHDGTWDAVKPVEQMVSAMGEGTSMPTELIPRCPKCGAEAFPWVRGYGNFLQGKKYDEQYQKISKYIQKNTDKKILFLELGVGRLTPMFIQEPFWNLTLNLPDAYYISVNAEYDFLPEQIEDKGIVIRGDIGKVLKDVNVERRL